VNDVTTKPNRRSTLAMAVGATVVGAAARPPEPRDIYLLAYPELTALDLVGPQHIFALLDGYRVHVVGKDSKEIVSDTGLVIRPTRAIADCVTTPAVLFVPGGTDGTIAAMNDPVIRTFVAQCGSKATYVTSVCTGSLILGAAGLLRGYKATSHWMTVDRLKAFGAEPVHQRVVVDRNRVTGAGVTAGIDFALTLVSAIRDAAYAKACQLMMEYDPKPPFRNGHPSHADADSKALLAAMGMPFLKKLDAAIARHDRDPSGREPRK
jgi:cyclohexyl-isocyanide hydratase